MTPSPYLPDDLARLEPDDSWADEDRRDVAPVSEPSVCADVLWCGLPAGHAPVVDHRGHEITHAVTADGVYDIPAADYHADPTVSGSLSSTGARGLLPPAGCPAKYAYELTHGRPDRAVFEEGRAAHRIVLGAGADVEVVETNPNSGAWDTKEIKAKVAAVRAAGRTPVKPEVWDRIGAMAAALRAHDLAPLLLGAGGKPEQALFWTDRETGVFCRTMVDQLPPTPERGRLILADYKTAHSVEPDALRRSMHEHGNHQQAAWILDAVEELGLVEPGGARVVFVCQEKRPPYLVEIYEPDTTAMLSADFRNRRSRRLYAECARRGRWPGYSATQAFLDDGRWPDSDVVIPLALPPWAERDELQEMNR